MDVAVDGATLSVEVDGPAPSPAADWWRTASLPHRDRRKPANTTGSTYEWQISYTDFSHSLQTADRSRPYGGSMDDPIYSTLEKLSADHVGDRGQQRRGDAVWRVRFRDGWLYLLILLEFQSRNDAVMALRMLEYTALLYGELNRLTRAWQDREMAAGAAGRCIQRRCAVDGGARDA